MFPNKRIFRVYVSGFGTCRSLLDVSLMHIAVSFSAPLKQSYLGPG